ncbi:MAG: ABC transporter permease, partial [Actinomycetes bacterium]
MSGRYPTGPSQVAVTRQLASRYGLHVGGTWTTAPGGPKRVVGVVENPQDLLDNFALVPPGQLQNPTKATVLFDASPAQVAAFSFPAGAVPQMRPPPASGLTHATIVLILATFGLVFIGLVSMAGFTVMAQRRLRSLGMIGSLGATDRNIRLVMVANGAVVGLVATVIGAAIGFAAWFAYTPHLQASANHVVDAFALPWWTIGACMALAIVTATLAARWPARAVARVPVVTALAGRPAPPRPTRRSAVPGVVLLAVGLLLLAAAGPGTGASNSNLFLLLGILATVFGGLLFSPLAITALGGLARRAPVAVRLALRDLGRYRAR